MSKYVASFQCAEPGCREWVHWACDTRRDQAESRQRQERKPWRCTRHADPERNLRPDNVESTITLVAQESKKYPDLEGLFWTCEGQPSSGFIFGPGFNAHADDFPAGTKITVTTRVEVPDA